MSRKGTQADYGMLAKEDIEEGEVLFIIPRSVLLHHGTSKVSAVLEQGAIFCCEALSHKKNIKILAWWAVQLISSHVLSGTLDFVKHFLQKGKRMNNQILSGLHISNFNTSHPHSLSHLHLPPGKELLESSSGWVPLLMALLYEYTSPESPWAPYLSLWTDFSRLDQPLFWSATKHIDRFSLVASTISQ